MPKSRTKKEIQAELDELRQQHHDKLREVEEQIQELSTAVDEAMSRRAKTMPGLIGYAQALRELLALPKPADPTRPLNGRYRAKKTDA